MSDGLDQSLIAAVLALLPAAPPITVCPDGFVPNGTQRPYVLVYSSVGRPRAAPTNAIDGLSRTLTARFIAHCAGETAASARAAAAYVHTYWLDVRPVVAGLNCDLIAQESYRDPVRDESTGTLVMDSICTYTLTATT